MFEIVVGKIGWFRPLFIGILGNYTVFCGI